MGYIPYRSKAVSTQDEESASPTVLDIWLFFNIAGDQILLPLLVLTFLFSRAVTRNPNVINVCVTWIVAGIASSLLFYKGQHVGPEPEKDICIAQMALIASAPPMTSVAALALVYYTWSTFRHSNDTGPRALMARLATICLLVAPYVVYVCFVAVGLYLGLQHPEKVDRARHLFYCSVDIAIFNNAIGFFTAGVCLLATALQGHLLVMLSHRWISLRRIAPATSVDLQLTIRVGVFVGYVVATSSVMMSTFSRTVNATSVFPDLFGTSAGTMVFLVFATQPDVLRAWTRILLFPFTSCRASYKQSRLPSRTPTPAPSFDDSLLKRTDGNVSEKARLAALHAYFVAQVSSAGSGVEVIKRPEDAFILGRRAWGADGEWGAHWR